MSSNLYYEPLSLNLIFRAFQIRINLPFRSISDDLKKKCKIGNEDLKDELPEKEGPPTEGQGIVKRAVGAVTSTVTSLANTLASPFLNAGT